MNELHNKISYLHGLAEGLDLDTSTNEGKIIAKMLEVLDDMSEAIHEIYQNQIELENYTESLDEDLADLEEDFYEEFDDEEDFETDYMEVECPKCNDIVYFEADLLDADDIVEISCPNCDEVVYTIGELDEDEE